MSRSRRRAVKEIDYSKEQEFSDDDVFEDGLNSEPSTPAPARRRTNRPRKSVDAEPSFPGTEGPSGVYQPTKQYYAEKGYDPSLPPIRERFTFAPEFEEDGSPKIDLIVGRRPIDDKSNSHSGGNEKLAWDEEEEEEEEEPSSEDEDVESGGSKRNRSRRKKGKKKKKKKESPNKEAATNAVAQKHVEYEYLIKYKGKSYLHLEWKSAADLESMNKSAKALYRRFLKKLAAGTDEDLEDPNFDPSYAEPEKIVDEEEQEVLVELSDKELVEWEKERERELAEEEEAEEKEQEEMTIEGLGDSSEKEEEQKEEAEGAEDAEDKEENAELEAIGDPGTVDIEQLRKFSNKEGPYYSRVEGSDNPYRDGYVTEPPKKPRASYLFFQCCYRGYFQKKYSGSSVGEVMTILGDTWRSLSESEQAPFLQLAQEEAIQYEKERALLEKAQKPTEVWQPLRRCRMVLDRLCEDGYSSIFKEPVDTDEFPDYEEFIDQPMDLGTVLNKLNNRKYQAPEQFARDVRKVWNNCKIYNQHGSAIWHVADYLSKQFERLYHAWVLEFRDRHLRWANPKARPWEHTCRACDGKCSTPDEQTVLCDHCDSLYGMKCLQPPLKKLPTGVWHCPDCAPKVGTAKGIRMLSAVSEQAARKRAEIGDTPKKKVMEKMFLVKWRGLGYEHCTWEKAEDIDDDQLIAEFRRLNNMTPDEPELTEEDVRKVLDGAKHVTVETAGGVSYVPDLRSQLYSQTRAVQFAKFGAEVPHRLCAECGPKTKASAISDFSSLSLEKGEGGSASSHVPEVVECIADLVGKVSRSEERQDLQLSSDLPPLLTGEYDAVVPITSKGLMMNVGEIHGSVAFLGYRQFPDGSKGPSELSNLIRNVGDKIIAVDGVSTINKTFKEVIMLLRESGKNKFAYMRFLENKYAVCSNELTSVGSTGMFLVDELNKKFKTDRRRLLVRRRQEGYEVEAADVREEEDSDAVDSVGANEGSSDDDDSSAGSEGSFEPDSDDEELIIKQRVKQQLAMQKEKAAALPQSSPVDCANKAGGETEEKKESIDEQNSERNAAICEATLDSVEVTSSGPAAVGHGVPPVSSSSTTVDSSQKTKDPWEDPIVRKQETTRSLAYRLLDLDVGYSSDEAGDEDCAYFLDGVDSTFTTSKQAAGMCISPGEKDEAVDEKQVEDSALIPVKKNEFSTLGDRAMLCAAVTLTSEEADPDDFDNFPNPSSKEIAALKKAEDERRAKAEAETNETNDELTSEGKPKKLSKTKVEQVSTTTGEVIRVWAGAEDAAATLQIDLASIKQLLKKGFSEEYGDEVGGYRWRYAYEDAKVTGKSDTKGSDKSKKAFLEFRDKLYDHEDPHIYKNGNKLRDYQVDGVNWLASCYYKRHGCILADEMGLGKTVQIVSYIEHLHRVEKIQRPFLVVVPLSTVEHWRREFEGWTELQCCVYHDRQRIWRDILREYEWYYADRPHTPEFLKFDVLVTTYDTLIGDFDVIGQIPWRVTVVDEAHRLRNVKGKLLECMKEISARGSLQYGFQSRVLMTGTPLQNNTQELWTLLNFIEPFKFPSLEEFEHNFGNMNNREQVEALQRKITPFMLRRVKEDVAKDIPAKEETVIDVELTSIQKQYYRAIFEHNHSFLSMGATRAAAPKLMNIQMELRKCCNHPFLLDGVETRELEKRQKELAEAGAFEGKTLDEQHHMLNEHGYVNNSGKMVLLDKLLPKLRQEGHKVLIFSQMVKMLDLISEYCDFRGFRHERLDGRVRGNERQKAIDRFETEEDSFMFLLSTRAGGVGINLTAADICIIFDSDWNPQNDVQAQARCHRIGQTKDVRIYRLVTSRTFEQEMFDRASKKLGLEQAVLGTFGQDNDDDKPTTKEMEQLLKKGAYALLEDENDEIGKEFCSDDIESILAKRTRTRVVEGAKTASWLNKQGMVVSKSKFMGDSATAGINVDDPLFWQKVMPDFVTPTIMMTKLNDLSKLTEGDAPGPGRGRKKKKPVEPKGDEDGETAEIDDAEDEVLPPTKGSAMNGKNQLSRGQQKKVNKFMSDLTSMMDDIFEQEEDDSLPPSEKATCQKLLLTVSVKAKLFTEEQRNIAKIMLKRLEGDRRRRCRTGGDEPARFASMVTEDADSNIIPEQLVIRSSKKKRRGKRRKKDLEEEEDNEEEEPDEKRQKKSPVVGEDGYLQHSDSEGDWSDVGENLYGRKRSGISKKEAKRRRAWASDKDQVSAAGRPWPSFPRSVVTKVLSTLLDEMIKYDQSKGGLFSVPVPRDDFPEYYEQIAKPMDYGTMKSKLENGEYRSAQAMQKDFILVMQNCLQFNAPDSDIVKEARQQALMRPTLLKNAAMENNLFIAEDGSILKVYDDEKKDRDEEGGEKKDKKKKDKRKKDKEKDTKKSGDERATKRVVRCKECEGCQRKDCGECVACLDKPKFGGRGTLKQSCIKRKCSNPKEQTLMKKSLTPPKRRGRPSRKKNEEEGGGDAKNEGNEEDKEEGSTPKPEKDDDDRSASPTSAKKKPRIRISLGGKKTETRIPRKKRKATDDDGIGKEDSDNDVQKKRRKADDDDDEDADEEPEEGEVVIEAKRSKSRQRKEVVKDDLAKKEEGSATSEIVAEPDDPGKVYLDFELLKKEREELDGSFLSARDNFMKRGPWKLPRAVEKKFTDIAKHTLIKMNKHDGYQLFFEEVTEDEAPGYSDVVTNPMDFGTMKKKVEQGEYGEGSDGAAALYEDFLLVFDNCALYNDVDGEVGGEAARVLGLLPETFAASCAAVGAGKKGKRSKKKR